MTLCKKGKEAGAPRILVCEDTDVYAKAMIDGLQEKYPEAVIDWAKNLGSAVALIKANRYQLIVTDYEYRHSLLENNDVAGQGNEAIVEHLAYKRDNGFSDENLKADWSALEPPWREWFEKGEVGYPEAVKHPLWEKFGYDSGKFYSGGMLIHMLRSGVLGQDKRETPVILQSGHVNKEALTDLLAPELDYAPNKTAFILKEIFGNANAMLPYPVVLHSGNFHQLQKENLSTVESNVGRITQGWSKREPAPGLFAFHDGTVHDKYEGTVSKTRFIRAFQMALQGLGLDPDTLSSARGAAR